MPLKQKGTLYIVATPIGNLQDITLRAIEILKNVDGIAAEDTRKASILLNHFSIQKPTISLHEHNEGARVNKLIEQLMQGKSIALISDAGTPLISDPGYLLIKAAEAHHIKISPIPGACAAIAALSASGLPVQSFIFCGFPPAKTGARQKFFENLKDQMQTLAFYEAPHRLLSTLKMMLMIFGNRKMVIARELTKLHEAFVKGNIVSMIAYFESHMEKLRGEIVILIEGQLTQRTAFYETAAKNILDVLMAELPAAQAVQLASKITGIAKNKLYKRSLEKKK